MSKRRKVLADLPGIEPSLGHAAALVQEYTGKLRRFARRLRDVREKYVVTKEKHLRLANIPDGPTDQRIWFEQIDGFRSQDEEYSSYLRALVPQARKLAQHVSQLITHSVDDTIVKIELSLRVAELESAIRTAQALFTTSMPYQPF